MTKKEFVSILRNIKAEWREIARRDPTAYRRGIVVDVGEDEAYIESLFECRGGRVEEYQIVVRLQDGTYKIYFVVEQPYISPADDIWHVINENKLDWAYIV
jgi:hypothetical protein